MGKILGEEGTRELITKVQSVACNPNLLDNWYWKYPVNQRNKSEYSEIGYCIDRWTKKDTNPIRLTADGLIFDSPDACIIQKFEDPNLLQNTTVTFSALYSDGTLAAATTSVGAYDSASDDFHALAVFDIPAMTTTNGAGLWWYSAEKACGLFLRSNTATPIVAVKLELGTSQTLAHKEGGKWVLNEVPNYADQLARCQRYQLDLFDRHTGNIVYVGLGIALDATTLACSIPTPVTLCKVPAIVTDCSESVQYRACGPINGAHKGAQPVTALKMYCKTEHQVGIYATSSELTPDAPYILHANAGPTRICLLDANI